MRTASIRRFIWCVLLLSMPLNTGLLHARCEFQGIIRPISVSTCGEGETHSIVDPCTGAATLLRTSLYDLNAYTCQNVIVNGPGVATVFCQGCQITLVQSLQPQPASCVIQVMDLTVNGTGAESTWLQWSGPPCFGTYDVIKGDLEGFTATGSGVDLGRATCLVGDHPIPSTFNGPRDSDVPASGRASYYLVRAKGPNGVTPYGLSSWGEEEIPAHGCPL